MIMVMVMMVMVIDHGEYRILQSRANLAQGM